MTNRIDAYHESDKNIAERTCEALEAMVEQNDTIIKMQRLIITELGKIVQGNAALFDQLRALCMLQENEDKIETVEPWKSKSEKTSGRKWCCVCGEYHD